MLFCFFYMVKEQQNGFQTGYHSVNNEQNGINIMYHSVFRLTEWHPFFFFTFSLSEVHNIALTCSRPTY